MSDYRLTDTELLLECMPCDYLRLQCRSYIIKNLENGIQLGHDQQLADAFAGIHQQYLAIFFAGLGEQGDEDPESAGVDVLEVREIDDKDEKAFLHLLVEGLRERHAVGLTDEAAVKPEDALVAAL